jgi:DNA-binding MarR family transcriptional regulator
MSRKPSSSSAPPPASLPERVITGLSKIGLALKSQSWQEAGGRGLTPTQGQVLVLLRATPKGMRLSAIAEALGIKLPTASESVATLVDKGLVRKERSAEDGRALSLVLTPQGKQEAQHAASWPDFLADGVELLSPEEQEVFLRGLIKLLRSLQQKGAIPVQRMCVSCDYFRPYVHEDPKQAHHCAFVDAPLGDRHLRLDCAEQAPAGAEDAERTWRTFLEGPSRS